MKLKSLLTGVLLLIAAATCVAYFLFKTNDRSAFLEQQAMLVMRGIGHQVLLKAGDSTSRVLPVKRINATVFQLEFQSTFNFVPDTLVHVVHASLASGQLPLQYMVNVMECTTNQIIYGYRIGSGRISGHRVRGRAGGAVRDAAHAPRQSRDPGRQRGLNRLL